jgi:CDP-glycerol glycerophosphotransferase
MSEFSTVILAAGMGTRLGRPFPKPLTHLDDGRSIMQQQLANIAGLGRTHPVHIVVGFKKELIMEEFPDEIFLYNPDYSETNTSKSLMRALQRTPAGGGVLWLNGDVVFDPSILDELASYLGGEHSVVCVNHAAVGEEEVKYSIDDDGFVRELSKRVVDALGEAVGINYVAANDRDVLLRHLEKCDDNDYFERAIETAIAEEGMRVKPLDISQFNCLEVDFEDDLARANSLFHG